MPWKQKYVDDWFAEEERRRSLGLPHIRVDNNLQVMSWPVTIVEVGSYRGNGAMTFKGAFPYSILTCYEPISENAAVIEEFANSLTTGILRVKTAALGTINGTMKIDDTQDGASVVRKGTREIQVLDVLDEWHDWMLDAHSGKIDLLDINIEGAEYDLLDHMIEGGLHKHIRNIQVQFHDYIPNADRRMMNIQHALSQTHDLAYQFPFVYENWKLK